MRIFIFLLMSVIAGFFYFSPEAKAAAATCNRDANGHFIVPDEEGFANCFAAADTIGATFKGIYVCKGFPEVLNNYRNCQNLELSEFTAEVSKGFEFDTTFAMPFLGTYDHAVVVNGKDYTVSGYATFNEAIQGGNQALPNGFSSGRYCQAPSVDFSMHQALNQGDYALLSECSDTEPETPHKIRFTRNTMKAISDFTNAYPTHNEITPGIGGALLVDANGALATSSEEVQDVVYLIPLDNPIVITDATQTAEITIAMDFTLGVSFGCDQAFCVAAIIPGLLAPKLSFD
jgi:hypothetical protein